MICTICDSGEHHAPDCNLAELDGRKFHNVRIPATINPDDREKWRALAGSYAHLGRSAEL